MHVIYGFVPLIINGTIQSCSIIEPLVMDLGHSPQPQAMHHFLTLAYALYKTCLYVLYILHLLLH